MTIDHTSNMLTNGLDAAREINVALCLLPKEAHYGAREHLLRALHCALIVAEEGRQAHLDADASTKAEPAASEPRCAQCGKIGRYIDNCAGGGDKCAMLHPLTAL